MTKLEVRSDETTLLNTFESEGELKWSVSDNQNLVIMDEGTIIAEFRSYNWASVQYVDED